jgi:hypothetical protein
MTKGETMSIKLGQLLIKAGRISAEQLEEALRNQVVHGGKLGTNLVEMGFIKEQELALILGHKLGVPFISAEQIAGINNDALQHVSAEIADKYKVIPLALEKKRLSLAMADPSDFAAIDAISFLTGFIVRPVVCPELLLIKLLEKHYNIKRKLRYVSSPQPQQVRSPHTASATAHHTEHDVPSAVTEHAVEQYEFPMFENFEGFHQLQGDQFEELYLGGAYRSSVTMDTIAQELAEARNRDAIAQTVLQFVSLAFPVTALLLIRNTTIIGWKALVRGEQPQGFANLHLPVDAPSILNTVLTTKTFYLGPVPDTPANLEIIKALASRRQGASLVLPISILDRIVLFLYLEGEPDQLTVRLTELQRLVAKTSMAFEVLILRNKILMT